MEFDVVILGGGAAGMMAGVAVGEVLREAGGVGVGRVGLFEKNVRPGIKVLVCGGGRCNFTNAGSRDFLIGQFGRNGRFLTPALEGLDNEGLRDFFAGLGVPSHVEHDGKVYPDSNQARSVVDALVRRMGEVGVETFCGSAGTVTAVTETRNAKRETRNEEGEGFEVGLAGGGVVAARYVILAVGGMSYQRMGTVGDGYRIAAGLGHSIVQPRPAIVGLLTREQWVKEISGLAVRDVEVRIEGGGGGGSRKGKMENRKSLGDMLFTHFGLSGPAILNPSEIVAELLEAGGGAGGVGVRVDFLRHVSHEELHGRMRGWQQHEGRKRLKTMLSEGVKEIVITTTSPDQTGVEEDAESGEERRIRGVPGRLAEVLCRLEGISGEMVCASLTAAQMHRLVERLKGCLFEVVGTRGFKEAMVTAGGVKLSEVEPRTMESRVVPGLFLTGEVLDLTGPSGGYNLQLAFSTGRLAGREVGRQVATRRKHEGTKDTK